MSFWIRTAERPDSTHFYYFSKTIDIDVNDASAIRAARIVMCADSRYRLYVNGQFAGEGPCQGSEYTRYYETYESDVLLPLLKPGKNEILVKVLYLQEGSFISIYRGSRPALWLEGAVITGDRPADNAGSADAPAPILFGTDAGWQCVREDNVKFHHCPRVHTSTPPAEEHLGALRTAARTTPQTVQQLGAPVPGGYNLFGLADQYPLEARPIPQLTYGEAQPFRVVRQGDDYIEIDAGAYTTALPRIGITGTPGAVIKILYAECYGIRDRNGELFKDRRDAYDLPEADLITFVYDVIHLPDSGEYTFEPFWYRAFRFLRLEFSDPSVRFPSLTYRSCFYPFSTEGCFNSNDPALNEMWKVSVNTVNCCAHEIFVDCPYFEQQQYDMDSCLEMRFAQRMSADGRLLLKSVTDLARSQIYNGMLQANYPSTMTQIIPNFTLFWVIMLREYLRYAPATDDTRRQAAQFLGTVDKALESFEIFRDATGLVGANPYWSFVDWVPGWMAGITPGGHEGEPLTVASMMFTAALKNAAEVAEYCGRNARSKEYLERADKLSALIREKCYDKDAQLFRNTPTRREFSEHTSVWAVLAGIVSGKDATALMRRTMDPDAKIARCTFSMGSFLFRALELTGLYDEFAPKLFAGWQQMLDYHCTTWCENPDSPRSECHGWSSAPAYELSAMVLGAYPEKDGYRTLRVRPHMYVLNTEWAEGGVPTPFGTVNISLRRTKPADRRFAITVTLPDGKKFERDNCRDGDEFRFELG